MHITLLLFYFASLGPDQALEIWALLTKAFGSKNQRNISIYYYSLTAPMKKGSTYIEHAKKSHSTVKYIVILQLLAKSKSHRITSSKCNTKLHCEDYNTAKNQEIERQKIC